MMSACEAAEAISEGVEQLWHLARLEDAEMQTLEPDCLRAISKLNESLNAISSSAIHTDLKVSQSLLGNVATLQRLLESHPIAQADRSTIVSLAKGITSELTRGSG
jgi:hypothetical protein